MRVDWVIISERNGEKEIKVYTRRWFKFTIGSASSNPFEDFEKWKVIAIKIIGVSEKQYTLRAIHEHIEHLIKKYTKSDNSKRKKSGTEEESDEYKRLLQEVVDLSHDFHNKQPRKKKKTNENIDSIQSQQCS